MGKLSTLLVVLLSGCSGAQLAISQDDNSSGELAARSPSLHASAIAACDGASYDAAPAGRLACLTQANDDAMPRMIGANAGDTGRVVLGATRFRNDLRVLQATLLAAVRPDMSSEGAAQTTLFDAIHRERVMASVFDGYSELGGSKLVPGGLAEVELRFSLCARIGAFAEPGSLNAATVVADCIRATVLSQSELMIPALRAATLGSSEDEARAEVYVVVSDALDAGTALCQRVTATGGYSDFNAILQAEGSCRRLAFLAVDDAITSYYPQ